MLATKINKKSIHFEMEPGERYGLDRDGYCIDSCYVSALEKDTELLRNLIKSSKNGDQEAIERLPVLKDALYLQGKKRNVHKVFVGYSY